MEQNLLKMIKMKGASHMQNVSNKLLNIVSKFLEYDENISPMKIHKLLYLNSLNFLFLFVIARIAILSANSFP